MVLMNLLHWAVWEGKFGFPLLALIPQNPNGEVRREELLHVWHPKVSLSMKLSSTHPTLFFSVVFPLDLQTRC